jgi:hypothetical protein
MVACRLVIASHAGQVVIAHAAVVPALGYAPDLSVRKINAAVGFHLKESNDPGKGATVDPGDAMLRVPGCNRHGQPARW